MGRSARMHRAVPMVIGTVLTSAMLFGGATPALAAKPSGGGGRGSVATGNDVSYPQCGSSLPSAPAFGIVGVNDGLANNLNPCFGTSAAYPNYSQSELYWAVASATGSTSQPKASLYVNTGDPGNVYKGSPIADWPTSGSTPYGACVTTTVVLSGGSYTVGENSDPCAWQYGYDRASQDVTWLADEASALNAQQSALPVSGSASSYP